jgi:HK97 family phage major capsid protein
VIERRSIDEKRRTVELAFSSEEPVERWWGVEVLGHRSGEVDLSWVGSGRAPLLADHDPKQQIGVVVSARLGADRKGRATVRFGSSPRAEQEWRDVVDGVRQNVSVGYEIGELQLERQDGDASTYRATRWTPLEISLVSVPADSSVGIGRDGQAPHIRALVARANERNSTMDDQSLDLADTGRLSRSQRRSLDRVDDDPATRERERVTAIDFLAKRHKLDELGSAAIRGGISIERFREQVLDELERRGTSRPLYQPPSEIVPGLSRAEESKFSIVKAIRAKIDPEHARHAGFELEVSRALERAHGAAPRGVLVPYGALAGQRTMVTSSAPAGGNLVGTELLADEFTDLLRARTIVAAMGATVMPGLVGNVAIPGQTGPATSAWVAEEATLTASDPTLNQITLSPKTTGAMTEFSRLLMLQSAPGIEQIVRSDLTAVLARAIDTVAISGTGTSNQPRGVLNTAGIGAVAGGTNGAAPTWDHLVSLEAAVAAANADQGALGYLTNSAVRARLRRTQRATNLEFVWSDGVDGAGFSQVAGRRAGVSNLVPSNLTKGTSTGVCSAILFGNWADLLIGQWGVLDIQVDPYSLSAKGGIRIVAWQTIDVAVRRPASFAAMTDALTT